MTAVGMNRHCRICGKPTKGAYVGIDSCRACAAFFRRTILEKKEHAYTCRSGRNDCDAFSQRRKVCKKCRYTKCVISGMLPEQIKAYVPSPSSDGNASPSSPMLSSPPSSFPYSASSIGSPPLSSSPVASPIEYKPAPQLHLVNRILQEYRLLSDRLWDTEMAVLSRVFSEQGCDFDPNQIYECTLPVISQVTQACEAPVFQFFADNFQEFRGLSMDDQKALFRNYYSAAIHLDEGIRTTRGVAPGEKRRLWSRYLFNDYYEYLPRDGEMMLESARKLLWQECCGDFADKLRDTFYRIALSDDEWAIYSVLMMWSPVNTGRGLSDAGAEVCAKVRQAIFRELHTYYSVYLDMPMYAMRLGECIKLLSNVKEGARRIRRINTMQSCFGEFSRETYLERLSI